MSDLKVVNFKIGQEEYAIDIMKVDSIVPVEKILRIPDSPPSVEGLMDFRGTAIPVINGRKKFSSGGDFGKAVRAIVVNSGNKKVGILVDEVKEVISLSQRSLEEPPIEISTDVNRYIGAISNSEGRMIIILDVDKILSEREVAQLSNEVIR